MACLPLLWKLHLVGLFRVVRLIMRTSMQENHHAAGLYAYIL